MYINIGHRLNILKFDFSQLGLIISKVYNKAFTRYRVHYLEQSRKTCLSNVCNSEVPASKLYNKEIHILLKSTNVCTSTRRNISLESIFFYINRQLTSINLPMT